MPQGRRRLGKGRPAPPPPPPPYFEGAGRVVTPLFGELTHDEAVRLEALEQARSYAEKRGMKTSQMLEVAKQFEKFLRTGVTTSDGPGEAE